MCADGGGIHPIPAHALDYILPAQVGALNRHCAASTWMRRSDIIRAASYMSLPFGFLCSDRGGIHPIPAHALDYTLPTQVDGQSGTRL